MIKNFLIAAAFVIASPAFVFSQDIFWSFNPNADQNTTTAGSVGSTGTAYIFSDLPFSFDAIDLDFSTSNSAAVLLTGGSTFNEPFSVIGSSAFNAANITIDAGGATGNYFAVNATQNGINPMVTPLFNPHFVTEVGINGAVLLASVDYEIVGEGGATLDFSLGTQGALDLPDIFRNPTFGSGTIAVEAIPEPSSAALLVLGAAAMVARRKRSST